MTFAAVPAVQFRGGASTHRSSSKQIAAGYLAEVLLVCLLGDLLGVPEQTCAMETAVEPADPGVLDPIMVKAVISADAVALCIF